MSFKMVFAPPQTPIIISWVEKLCELLPHGVFKTPSNYYELVKEIADADAAFGNIQPQALALAQRIKWIQAPAAAPPAGYYYKQLIQHPCTVTNFRGVYNDHISAHIMGMLLTFAKNLHIYRDQQRQKVWKPLSAEQHSVFLPESVALIVGFGGIGMETARLCEAFGMQIIGIDPRINSIPDTSYAIYTPERLNSLLPKSDFVILTMPHTPDTEKMFSADKFSKMKKGSFFINIGRGMTTQLEALTEALQNGTIAGAGLDVFEEEPLPQSSPLWGMDNVIITPHIAAHGGKNIEERKFKILLTNIERFTNNLELVNIVDKEKWF